MIAAMILPNCQLTDMTIDQVIKAARKSGLVACNKMQGPFRISFFPQNRVPKGWARIGVSEVPPCAA